MGRSEYDTSQTLLRRVADWSDRTAWARMHERYDPLIERWSRRRLENATDVLEFKQILWIEIARRIVAFRYDPGRSFRKWLKTLHRSRIADFRKSLARASLRAQRHREFAGRGTMLDRFEPDCLTTFANPEPAADPHRLERAQAVVKQRFRNRSWNVFWAIAMEDRSIRETADEFGMSYTATFAAYARVRNALKQEMERDTAP